MKQFKNYSPHSTKRGSEEKVKGKVLGSFLGRTTYKNIFSQKMA